MTTTGCHLTPPGHTVGGGSVDPAAANPEPGFSIWVVPLERVNHFDFARSF